MTDPIQQAISASRRDFLRAVTRGAAGAPVFALRSAGGMATAPSPRVVVVTFGGGARDDETFRPEGHENIPHLLSELLPRGTVFSQVVNRGILGHYVANASLATGAYETFNNFAPVPPLNPTVFEYFRKDRNRPAKDVWVVAPSNGFNRIGESDHRSYGKGLGAGVILPKRLLAAPLASGPKAMHRHLLTDNYETARYAPGLTRQLAPALLWITTRMYILPDFGRDSDIEAGGNGFQHHRTSDPVSRTTWMLAIGQGIRENVIVDRPIDSLDLVPTLGAVLGFDPRYSKGKPLPEVS
jgi:hypothetical protein